jgi:hypothetical protein
LAEFEAARVEWESAFGRVPDGALAYLKPGDDYSLGGLQTHVNWVLLHYGRILDGIIAHRFGELSPQDAPGEADAAARRAKDPLTATHRRRSLAEMERLHSSILAAAHKVAADDWSRRAAVVYGEGQDPYPTSPDDVIGWLRDHYREHVQQSADLVAEWEAVAT